MRRFRASFVTMLMVLAIMIIAKPQEVSAYVRNFEGQTLEVNEGGTGETNLFVDGKTIQLTKRLVASNGWFDDLGNIYIEFKNKSLYWTNYKYMRENVRLNSLAKNVTNVQTEGSDQNERIMMYEAGGAVQATLTDAQVREKLTNMGFVIEPTVPSVTPPATETPAVPSATPSVTPPATETPAVPSATPSVTPPATGTPAPTTPPGTLTPTPTTPSKTATTKTKYAYRVTKNSKYGYLRNSKNKIVDKYQIVKRNKKKKLVTIKYKKRKFTKVISVTFNSKGNLVVLRKVGKQRWVNVVNRKTGKVTRKCRNGKLFSYNSRGIVTFVVRTGGARLYL